MDGVERLALLSLEPTLKERRTTADYVADSLRAGIQSGILHDGMELNQVAIAGHFRISRVPVREALRALEAEGWITARPHHRAVVQALSLSRIEQTFEVRALLEAHLIGKAIRRIGKDQLDELFALCDAMDQMGDHAEWVAANRRLHRTLLQSSGADMIVDLVGQLSSQVERYLRLCGTALLREGQAGAEHRAILRAVADHDVRNARALVREHINETKTLIVAALRDVEASRKPVNSSSEEQ